ADTLSGGEAQRIRLASQIGAGLVGVMYILDETSDMLHLENHNHPYLINNIISLNQTSPSLMTKAAKSGKLAVIKNIDGHKKHSAKNEHIAYTKNYHSNECIIAPLICQSRVVGVLNLADKIDGDHFTPEDITLIELFRQLIGASIGNIKLFEKTQHQAMTDGLTNLANHKTFYKTLERELRRLQRYGEYLSVIMIDIDNLKPINDNYGHRAGDLAIKHVSKKIFACIRKSDTAARYGGDEFAVILPNTSLTDAVIAAERMVSDVANSVVMWERHRLKLSISVGVGQYDSSCCPEQITRQSDNALYAAKLAGKNTVKISENCINTAAAS
ncbi:MAG: diguanylate cyclase, partial [Planctomycetes bacterium]|nr:diguanylate cyclase [Planctomycetota bacterium]